MLGTGIGDGVRNKNVYFNIFNFRLRPHYPLKWARRDNVTPPMYSNIKRKNGFKGGKITDCIYFG